jgi:hypothetical protein
MFKFILAAIFCGLALTCLGATNGGSQGRLSALIDSNNEAAITYFTTLLTEAQTDAEVQKICYSVIMEQVLEKFDSAEDRANSLLSQCLAIELFTEDCEDCDLPSQGEPEKVVVDPKNLIPTQPPKTPSDEDTPTKGEAPIKEGTKGEAPDAPEAPTRDDNAGHHPAPGSGDGDSTEPEAPEAPSSSDREAPEEPEAPEKETEEPEVDFGSIWFYQASYYIEDLTADRECMRMDTVKADTGLMAELYDICILVEDGWLYLTFQETADSDAEKVLIIGEDSRTYSVTYDTEVEVFTVSQGLWDGTYYKHQDSHEIESMYLASVWKLYLSGDASPYVLQSKYVVVVDETYIASTMVDLFEETCFTPTEGRLMDIEVCVSYSTNGVAEVWADGLLVRKLYDVEGGCLEIEYTTQDDCLRLSSQRGTLLEILISTEILFVAGEGVIAEKATGETLSISIEYDVDGDILQYDCINLYNHKSLDLVLYSTVNILCVYCIQVTINSDDAIDPAHCGIGFYGKEKQSSVYTRFEEIDRKLTIIYETTTENLHILYGDEQLSLYADEIFYFIETIQEHSLEALVGDLDSDYLTGSLSTAACQRDDGDVCHLILAGQDICITCDDDGCYIGSTKNGIYSAGKLYSGDWDQVKVYEYDNEDYEDAYKYCLSFHAADGDIINHCLMIEQLEMYRDTLTKYPIFTL